MTSSLSTQEIFERARAASRQSAEVPLAQRHDRLARLQRLLDENEAALAAAVDADFGGTCSCCAACWAICGATWGAGRARAGRARRCT